MAATGLIIAQAGLLARALSAVMPGTGAQRLTGTLALLLGVVVARAVASAERSRPCGQQPGSSHSYGAS